jgi:hypothetical protein
LIAYNLQNGISLVDDSGDYPNSNELRGNRIFNNRGLGIDLNVDGVTPNDAGDADTGPNQLQNYPELTSDQGSFRVSATLHSQPNTTYTLDLYRSSRCDRSGYGEGEQHLTSVQVTTNQNGLAGHEFDLTGMLTVGEGVAATAADPQTNTSEFSNCITLVPAPRTSLLVNWDGDQTDAMPGDGTCETANGNGQCSLRAAIEELNAQGISLAPHRIEFEFPGTGPFTIKPQTALPEISVPIEIAGHSQPGAACPTPDAPASLLVVLDGSDAGPGVSGLVFAPDSSGSGISGLVIGNFSASGIHIESEENTVRCSHIGIGADGVTVIPNSLNGIALEASYNRIGGDSAAAGRNVISGNKVVGLAIHAGVSATYVINNFIGTTADGMSAAGNEVGGVTIAGHDNFIFGTYQPTYRNVISGNSGYGIRILNGSDSLVFFSYIGLARDGLTPLPNHGNGIEILGESYNNSVGGPVVRGFDSTLLEFSNANQIAYNDGHGIMLKSIDGMVPLGNRFYQNSIFDNGGLGIDLGDDGVDVNDAADADSGENERFNYPWLSVQGGALVTATLEGPPNTDLTVEFYRSTGCDASGYGEGQQYLYTERPTTDSSGQAAFTVDLSGMASPGDTISALAASNRTGNTSEFSNCVILPGDETGYRVYLPAIWR